MSKPKITYTATSPDGTTVTFTSTRIYTHAVWVNNADGGQGFVKWTASPAQALKNPGQSGAQSDYFRSLGHGIVELGLA